MIARVIVKRQAGIVDEDIERFHSLDSTMNLRSIGEVQGQRCDAPIPVDEGPARAGIQPLRASQGFLDRSRPMSRSAPVTKTALSAIVIHLPAEQNVPETC